MKRIVIGQREVKLEELVALKNEKELSKVKDINKIEDLAPQNIKEIFENKGNKKELFFTLKQDVKEEKVEDIEDTSVRGFLVTSDVEKAKDKVLMLERISKHLEKDIYALKGRDLDDAVELQFVENIYIVEFMDKPFIEKIDEINEVLIKIFDTRKEDIEECKYKINKLENAIRDYREYLTKEYEKLKRESQRLKVLEDMEIKNAYQQELENIVEHPAFENMAIKEGRIIFTTKYIDIYDPINKGVIYFGNKYKIEIELKRSNIKIYGLDKSRCNRSYWSSEDPHPHVSGETGYACLGSLSDTIAQLCSDKELYALFVVIVNFLETFNIEDYAGQHIKNWEVKEGGEHPYEPKVCPMCDEEIDIIVECPTCGIEYCEGHEVWNEHEQRYECQNCYDEYLENMEEEEEEGMTCPECGNEVEELHDYIDGEGNVTQMCEDCINE